MAGVQAGGWALLVFGGVLLVVRGGEVEWADDMVGGIWDGGVGWEGRCGLRAWRAGVVWVRGL